MARKTPEVAVKPAVLKWARESAGVDLPSVARRLGVNVETVEDWESGLNHPTLGTLQTLAVLYRRPLAALLLPQPPSEPPPPHDFRVLPREARPELSRETRLAIREARRVQTVAMDLARGLGRDVSSRVRTVAPATDPEEAAAEERKRLGVDLEQQLAWRTAGVALREWRRAVEGRQVLTLQVPMPLEEARGFCLPSECFPAAVLNARDAIHARIFTLFHEYGHLLLGSSAICIPEPGRHVPGDTGQSERFCNAFAGALLVPADELRREPGIGHVRSATALDEILERLSGRFRVSRHVVLYRLWGMRAIPRPLFEGKRQELEAQSLMTPSSRRGGLSPARRCLLQRGASFAELVFQAHSSDLITCRDVSDYLSVRVKHVEEVQSLLRG